MAYAEQNPGAAGPKGEMLLWGPDEIKFLAPVPNPSKIFSIAINNKQKFDIAEKPVDPHPLYSSRCRPHDGALRPGGDPTIGIVGSRRAGVRHRQKGQARVEEEAGECVYGYTVHNDITAHELRYTKEWIVSRRPEGDKRLTYAGRYKCFDTFAPMGPWLVTCDEIEDVDNLTIRAWVNGRLVQNGSTSDMFFKIPHLVSYLSGAHTLLPGDIVSGGTVQRPVEGVNFQKIDLRGWGGVLETEVEGIGRIKNPIKAV
jgi:2-keto-4-pentenoate hydratase/2-oxohepta-3-ene-1,7-dioic acid hydratase in catechol pathway